VTEGKTVRRPECYEEVVRNSSVSQLGKGEAGWNCSATGERDSLDAAEVNRALKGLLETLRMLGVMVLRSWAVSGCAWSSRQRAPGHISRSERGQCKAGSYYCRDQEAGGSSHNESMLLHGRRGARSRDEEFFGTASPWFLSYRCIIAHA